MTIKLMTINSERHVDAKTAAQVQPAPIEKTPELPPLPVQNTIVQPSPYKSIDTAAPEKSK